MRNTQCSAQLQRLHNHPESVSEGASFEVEQSETRNSRSPQANGTPLFAWASSNALAELLRILPCWVQDAIAEFGDQDLEEVALDLGRPLSLRSSIRHLLLVREVAKADLHYIVHRVRGFREDNRTGIDRTVHRIAAIRDRHGIVVGLTIRIGRVVGGSAEILRDLLFTDQSLLLVGPPGSGKTTILRDATRILADRWGARVIVVDTSNEIGGDGRVPHPGIGRARRVQVPAPSEQARILMQTLTNHGPQVLIVDELGFRMDVEVALSIARRGVQMLATVHGHVLDDVVENPDLAPLVGGIAPTGTAGRHRICRPPFGHAVEVRDHRTVLVHCDVAQSVDELCAGGLPTAVEVRMRAVQAPATPDRGGPPIARTSPQQDSGPQVDAYSSYP